MYTIGAFDAKTHFSQILNDVEDGKVIVITRHGRKIAVIKAITDESEGQNRVERAKAAIRQMRKGVTLGKDLTIRDMMEEGRR